MSNKRELTIKELAPLKWIPTLYMAEGIPYFIVVTLSVIMYKRFGLTNGEIALYTSWLYLPWVIKPFWSPFVDILKTKRWWILTMQLLIGAGLAGIAFSIEQPFMVQMSLAFFWLMAFSSATHDVAADGFFILALPDPKQQALYVGIRSTSYRIAMIIAQGALTALAGALEAYTRSIKTSWTITFLVIAGFFIGVWLYHSFVLPRPQSDKAESVHARDILGRFLQTFESFFSKPGIIPAIAFLLLYRFAEALLVKVTPMYLIDKVSVGGLGLSLSELAYVMGTIGVIGLIAGGILGSIATAADGLKKWYWPMVLAITLPNIVYVYLSYFIPDNMLVINACIFVEQFGYGFGFTAYMLFMLYFSRGESATSHYAICTAFMALSMMLPGMVAGYLQELLGYRHFFILVMVLCLFTFIAAKIVKFDFDEVETKQQDE